MKPTLPWIRSIGSSVLWAASALLLSGLTVAQGTSFPFHTPFAFNDAFYLENGLEPTLFDPSTVITPDSPNATFGVSIDPTRNNTRILAINAGSDSAGALLYYPAPPAFFGEEAFTDTPEGDNAREVADEFRAFIFPKKDSDTPFSPAAPNRRHDNMFDTSSGYLTDNPLGLWRITFVDWTEKAFTEPGQTYLQRLHLRNGTDLDGTPIIKRLFEIHDLEERGYILLRQRPVDGSEGPPWVV